MSNADNGFANRLEYALKRKEKEKLMKLHREINKQNDNLRFTSIESKK